MRRTGSMAHRTPHERSGGRRAAIDTAVAVGGVTAHQAEGVTPGEQHEGAEGVEGRHRPGVPSADVERQSWSIRVGARGYSEVGACCYNPLVGASQSAHAAGVGGGVGGKHTSPNRIAHVHIHRLRRVPSRTQVMARGVPHFRTHSPLQHGYGLAIL